MKVGTFGCMNDDKAWPSQALQGPAAVIVTKGTEMQVPPTLRSQRAGQTGQSPQ